jgi:DNA-binding NarL/FixJ family response regulator
MGLSISTTLSLASLTANSYAANSTAPAATQNTQQTANEPTDTIQLTEAQQVYNLYNQGQTVPQIADTLSLSLDSVNLYLGISSSKG